MAVEGLGLMPALNGFITSQKLGLTCLRPPPEPTKPRENVEMKLGCTCDSKRDMGKVPKTLLKQWTKSLKQGQVETFSQAALMLDRSLSTKYFLHLVACIRMSTRHADMLVFC